jgi:hypothetical protein
MNLQHTVLRIRITLMQIRIRLITLTRIWILIDADVTPTFNPDADADQDSNPTFHLMRIRILPVCTYPDPFTARVADSHCVNADQYSTRHFQNKS